MSAIYQQLRSPMRSQSVPQQLNAIQKGLAVLRRYGANAHAYLPGIGYINGLSAGNYTLADGSTGPAVVDGLDGLMLDGLGAVGAELVTNGTNPTVTTGWSVTNGSLAVVGGTLQVTSTASGLVTLQQTTTGLATGGKWQYSISTVTNPSGLAVDMYARATQIGTPTNALGTRTGFAVAGNTTEIVTIFIIATGAGQLLCTLNNISVKEVSGIHATAIGAARPTLRRGAVNLLTWSQDFTNAAWTAQNGAVKVNATTATVSAVDNSCVLQTILNTQTNLPNTFAALLSGTGTISIFAFNVTNSFMGLQTVTLTATPTLYAINFTPTVNGSSVFIGWKTGNTATGFTSGGAGLFTGTLTAQQILNQGGIPLTTTTAASNPNAGLYSAEYSGAQALTLGSVPFQMADDHCVIAACRPDSTAGANVFSLGNSADNSPIIVLDFSAGTVRAFWRDNAAMQVALSITATLSAPVVISMRKVGNTRVLRVNGVQVMADTTALGATTFNQAKIGVQGRVADSNFFLGPIGWCLPLKGTFTDSDMLTLERLVASAFPNAPSF